MKATGQDPSLFVTLSLRTKIVQWAKTVIAVGKHARTPRAAHMAEVSGSM